MNTAPSVMEAATIGLTEQYEALRANALGRMNRSCGLLEFLRQGMGSWVRALDRLTAPATAWSPAASPRATDNALAGIVADAILEALGPVNPGGR